MSDPVIEEYLAQVDSASDMITLTTGVGTTAGWWLLAVHSVTSESVGDAPMPTIGSPENWRLLGEVRSRDGDNPAHRVWVRKLATGGATAVSFPAVSPIGSGVVGDHHARLYVLSGVRAYNPFRFRGSKSPGSEETSQILGQGYAPDDDALLIGVWLAGGATFNYTLPGSMTAQTELDGTDNTSRSGYEALSAAGPTGTRTATASVTHHWAGVLVIVSGSQGAISFPTSPLAFRVEAAFGADLADHPDDWTWTDITTYVFWRDGIGIKVGRDDESGQVEYGSCAMTLDNIISGIQGGRFSSRNPLSPYYGQLRINTPLRVWIDPGSGFTDRFSGFVSSWPPRWTTGANRYIQITARGIFYRLGQGTPPTLSQFRRTVMSRADDGLLAYWPGEDEINSTRVDSARSDVPAMTITGAIDFAAFNPERDFTFAAPEYGIVSVGTQSLPQFAGGGTAIGQVPTGTSSPVAWTVCFAGSCKATEAAENIVFVRWDTPGGTYVRWEVRQNSAIGTEVAAYSSAGTRTVVLSMSGSDFSLAEYRVEAEQSGADVLIRFYEDGALQDSDTLATNTLAYVTSISANPDANVITGDTGLIVGHVQVWDADTTPVPLAPSLLSASAADDYGQAVSKWLGYLNEAAHLRLQRRCEEDGLLLDMQTVETQYVMRMDSQPAATRMGGFRQCEAVDAGVLYESGFGLGYLPRASRYNPPVTLALDYAQAHLWLPPEPTDDDQRLRNRQFVSRNRGNTAEAEDQAGPLGIGVVGEYEASGLSLIIRATENLDDRASMELALSTIDEYRYPVISVNLARSDATELIPDWLNMPAQGGRMTIANPPDDVPPETIDLIREGYTEFLNSEQWEVWCNCSPASPWLVWTVEGDDNAGRLETGGHVVAVSISSSTTTVPVMRSTGKKEITSQTGYDIELRPAGYTAGERVTVTAIATPSGAVAAGSASHAVNASVTPVLPSHSARDALYVIAAIRNSGAGVPATAAAGWELIRYLSADNSACNVALFGKIAASAAETDPVITFSGGVANADTTAWAIRHRGATLEVVDFAAQLNGSAQDIAHPGVELGGLNCFVLVIGWKQDDWTSVATLSGLTEIGEATTTTGDDQGIVWDRGGVAGRTTDYAAGSFVVTGGAAAISRGAAIAFRMIEHDLTVTRSVNGAVLAHSGGIDAGSTVQLWRPSRLAL